MDRKIIEELYKILIKGLPLTKEVLDIYNYTVEEITTLKNQGIIKEIAKNQYTLVSADGMYKYGVYLEISGQPKQSETCFHRCLKIDPKNRNACMHIMLIELKRKNYLAIENLFPILEKINKESHQEDNKLYQYLLGVILHYNKEYQEKMKSVEYDEVLIPNEENNPEIYKQNAIRMAIVKQKYPYAIKQLNDLIRRNIAFNIENEFLKELIIHALRVNNRFKSKLQIYALNKNYENIIKLLEDKSKNQFLGNMETYILNTTESILEIIETNEIPEVICDYSPYMYEALQGNNFRLARDINLDFIKKLNQNPKEDTLNILLDDLIERIDNLSKKIEPKEENIIKNTSNLTPEEELASYIKEANISIPEAVKKIGILPEQVTNEYIGYLSIPKINLTKGFLDKRSTENDVEKNILVVEGSTYPDTKRGNLILAGHSGTGWKAFFNDLYKLTTNDPVYVSYKNKKYTYNIVNIYKQPKIGKVAIYRNYDKTTLTLITCTNNDDYTQTIYIAELVKVEDE